MKWTSTTPTLDNFEGRFAFFWLKTKTMHAPNIVALYRGYHPGAKAPRMHMYDTTRPNFILWAGDSDFPTGKWAGPIPLPSGDPE